jgi:alpha-L-rhamnosidase
MTVAFNRQFFKQDVGYYDNGSQTSCVLPLAFGLVPDGQQKRVFDHLVKKIEGETNSHIGTGLIGGQWLMRMLSDYGRPDLAYTLASQETYPSWGYMVSKGATTIWELWNGDTADPAMNSGNHVMLVGDLGIWFYEYLAGIQVDPKGPGFKRITMKPHVVGNLSHVNASYRSMYGPIRSQWKRDGQSLEWTLSVPPNTMATVYVPASDAQGVSESGKPAEQSPGVQFMKMQQGAAVYEVGSGTYVFRSTLNVEQ